MSNARCLIEGVDIPAVDVVAFYLGEAYYEGDGVAQEYFCRQLGVMRRKTSIDPGEDTQIVCRRGLINTLIKGPMPLEKIIFYAGRDHGFIRRQVLAAARWFNVIEELRDGEVYWSKPEVLTVLNGWYYGALRQRATRHDHG